MNTNNIIILDLETGGSNPYTCEVTQIAACLVHPKTLEISNFFNTECRPENMDNLEEDALRITGKTKEGLAKAPLLKEAWSNFREYIKFNSGKNKYSRPIRAGYNILNFDNVILDRLCAKFGDIDCDGRQNLFSDFISIDMMPIMWMLTENDDMLKKFSANNKANIKFDTICKWLGLSTSGAHDALIDVKREAKVIVRFMNWFRKLIKNTTFEGTMSNQND